MTRSMSLGSRSRSHQGCIAVAPDGDEPFQDHFLVISPGARVSDVAVRRLRDGVEAVDPPIVGRPVARVDL